MPALTNEIDKTWTGKLDYLKPEQILVWGSNPEGRHGKGAAQLAVKFGATYGQGFGLQGQTYAIVTKNLKPGFRTHYRTHDVMFSIAGPRSVQPSFITHQIYDLYRYAEDHPEKEFIVVYQRNTKENLNGYTDDEIWEMFHHHTPPDNIYFHQTMPPQAPSDGMPK